MLRKAKSMGLVVFVADRDAMAPGMNEADVALQIDTKDEEALIQTIGDNHIQGVCTIATNLAPRVVASVCQRFSLPSISPEAAYSATDKSLMRRLCHKAGVPIADGGDAQCLNDAIGLVNSLGYPVLFKPADASGCRGIEVVRCANDIECAYYAAAREAASGVVVVEHYYQDALVFGAESLIHNGQTTLVMVADKVVRFQPRISTAGVTIPSVLTKVEIGKLRSYLEAIHQVIGLEMGSTHIDFIHDGTEMRVIDIGPRLAGGPMIHELAPRLTNIDMIECVLRQAVGKQIDPRPGEITSVGLERHLYAPLSGVIKDVQVPSLGANMTMQWRKPSGSLLKTDGTNVDRLGYVTAIAASRQEAERKIADVMDKIELTIQCQDGRTREAKPVLYID
jgi:biotin carboxylase